MTDEFNKQVMIDNISFLFEGVWKKIGELESEAGVSAGYISRISKEGNTKPGIDFIVKAAEALDTSIDTLLNVELADMTPTERYLISFLEKLKKDTLEDKLDWKKESAGYLNRIEVDRDGYVDHPLLSYETFYEEGETEYPDEVSRVVFVSNTYDCKTAINDNCYNLRLKNGSVLYLMDISKSVHKRTDLDVYAREVWMYAPGKGSSYLCSDRDALALAELVEELYKVVSERMKHPRIEHELKHVIDAFMKDDLSDDIDEDLPF